MKFSTCLVCKNEFYGRDNQIFCDVSCKNKHHNVKTRLLYTAGKHGKDKISAIQQQVYSNNERITKINETFEQEKARYKEEIAFLRKDYEELLANYKKFLANLENLRKKYYDALGSAKKLEGQIQMINSVVKLAAPMINKLMDNIGNMDKDKDDN